MAEFTMPSLGADMDEGLLQEWLVGPGDAVRKGDAVAVVETDKAAIEVESFTSGTVRRLLVAPGTRVPVGTPLALIEAGATPAPAEPAPAEPAPPEPAPPEPAPPGPAPSATAPPEPAPPEPAAQVPAREEPSLARGEERPAPPKTPGTAAPAEPREPAEAPGTGAEPPAVAGPLVRHLAELRGVDTAFVHGTGRGGRITRADVERAAPVSSSRVRATPYARRLAHELGVDLKALHGSGEGGAVRAGDVRASAAEAPAGAGAARQPAARTAPAAPPPADAAARTEAMRHAIGAQMARSKREIPHYYLSTTIDLAAAEEWRQRHDRGRPPPERMVPAALLLKAAAAAARAVPQLNGFWQDGGFVPGRGVHLGVAVSLREGGLMAPVIHDADTLTPEETMAALRDLVQRARRGRLRGSELAGATLTVTSLGDQGTEAVFGVIHPPQVALVGFGAVVERPWAEGGLLGVRPVVTATLSADHRATDGAVGARYLSAVDRLLHTPEEL
ncbi:dihydrolipoamide acetyltransferase family protein [Streptomyces sp. MS06]|uniref:dihydrolipoamide acetyltransferase family protein n=1 Tax=Streptomyces sp. MS06 TaxID=3385974 RepID=UPI0039A24590